jgi:hypothetical protein
MLIGNNIDLDQNQIINIVMEKLAAHPAGPVDGRYYYNTTEEAIYYRKSTAWVKISNSAIEGLSEGAGIAVTSSGSSATISTKYDDVTVTVNGLGQLIVKDGGITTPKLNDLSVVASKIANQAITFTKINDIPTMTVIGRVAAGTGVSSAIQIISDLSSADNSTLATSGGIKAYIDSSIANIGTLMGSFNASTSTNLPGSSSTKKGDYWYVNVAGTVQGQILNIGDVIIANQANPTNTNPNHYVFLESNRDLATTTVIGLVRLATTAEILSGTGQGVVTAEGLNQRTATESRTGLAQKASDAEFSAGTENTKFVTSAQVKSVVNKLGVFNATIGNGSATSFTITHGLNTKNVQAEVYRVSDDLKVLTTIAASAVNSIVVSFSKPPASNAYRITIFSIK